MDPSQGDRYQSSENVSPSDLCFPIAGDWVKKYRCGVKVDPTTFDYGESRLVSPPRLVMMILRLELWAKQLVCLCLLNTNLPRLLPAAMGQTKPYFSGGSLLMGDREHENCSLKMIWRILQVCGSHDEFQYALNSPRIFQTDGLQFISRLWDEFSKSSPALKWVKQGSKCQCI